MSFELHQRKHIDGELRSIARRQLRRASDTLRSANANTFDTAVHESRKSVKKVRAIVRVLEESGAAIPRKDRKRLKRAARELSRLRDAAAILETFDRVRRRYPKRLPEHTLALLRGSLIRAREDKARRARADGAVAYAAEQVDKTRRSAKRWKAPSLDLAEPIDVIADSYRRSRKAMRRAAGSYRSVVIHAWRKALKTLWYQLRLVKPLLSGLAPYVAELKRLETALGEDHNLVVLGATLRACRDLRSMGSQVRQVEQMAARMRPPLRKRAFALGRRLHEKDPRTFAQWLQRASKQTRQRSAAA